MQNNSMDQAKMANVSEQLGQQTAQGRPPGIIQLTEDAFKQLETLKAVLTKLEVTLSPVCDVGGLAEASEKFPSEPKSQRPDEKLALIIRSIRHCGSRINALNERINL